jgi:hypothetical protein
VNTLLQVSIQKQQTVVSHDSCTERHRHICEYLTTSKYTETAIHGQSR